MGNEEGWTHDVMGPPGGPVDGWVVYNDALYVNLNDGPCPFLPHTSRSTFSLCCFFLTCQQ